MFLKLFLRTFILIFFPFFFYCLDIKVIGEELQRNSFLYAIRYGHQVCVVANRILVLTRQICSVWVYEVVSGVEKLGRWRDIRIDIQMEMKNFKYLNRWQSLD